MRHLRCLLSLALLAPLASAAQLTCATALPVGLGQHAAPQVTGTAPAPTCSGSATVAGAGLWYSFTPTASMTVTVSSYIEGQPLIDTRMHVYTGTCGSLVCYAGDDDSGPGFTSIASFDATAGTTYLIAWDSYWSGGAFTFSILESMPPPPPPAYMVSFTDVAIPGASGILGTVDMNNDGRDDAVMPGFSSFKVAYQDDGGAFNVVTFPTTNAANTASWSFAVGDWDSNGHRDLLYGGGSGATFMTANADGSAYTQFSPPQYIFSQRTNFVDLNNDGHLDAFVCHDVNANVGFINDGAGNLQFNQGPYGSTCGNYGSIFTDIDNDCDMDLFVAKCGCDPQDLLMLNDGNGVFTNIAPALGLADSHQSWSSAWADFDNDGDMDVFIGSSSGGVHKLMRNNGDGTFTNITLSSGMSASSGQSIEWAAHDFNNDGRVDIMGGVGLHYNNGDGTFSTTSLSPSNHAIGDMNNDGFLDIATGSGYRRNNGNSNNWIRFNLRGTLSNRDAIGARVTITSALGSQMREIRSGDGFRYMSFIGAHFGLGEDEVVEEVTIRWPNCTVETIKNPAINTTHLVVEGLSTAVERIPEAAFTVAPNPAQDQLMLTGAPMNCAYAVVDASGRSVLTGRAANGRVSIAALSPGAYLLRITEAGGTRAARFVKQ